MDLVPCPACRRHAHGEACPFCGASLPAIASPELARGRFPRALVFAGALLAPACGGKHKPAADEMGEPRHHGGGGCVDPDPNSPEIVRLEKAKEEAATDEDKARIEEELQRARQPQCMPYGAPPARRRIV